MRLKSVPTAVVVKREDKEGQIRDYIARALAIEGDSSLRVGRRIQFVARSTDSPSARALLALGDKIAAAGICIEVIFAIIERPGSPWLADDGAPFAREIRHAVNPRLLDAHEQLILGDSIAWIGDSMRRDPDKRDAYEVFGTDSYEIVRHALLSFQRIWARSEPVCSRAMLLHGGNAQTGFSGTPEAGSGTLAATRH